MIMIEFEIKKHIQARMDELRPLVAEYERLQGAVLALKDIGPGRKPVAIVGHKPKHPEKARRYSKGEKEAALAMVTRVGVKKSARTYGIPEATIYRWLRASKES